MEHHEDDDQTLVEGEDQRGLHACARGLLKPLGEEELKGEEDGGNNDQSVIQALHSDLL